MIRLRETGNGIKTGDKIGRLRILGVQFRIRYDWFCVCECECGVVRVIDAGNLARHEVRSCGCLRSQMVADKNRSHGLRDEQLYGVWTNMISRCYNQNTKSFLRYGARGIYMCSEWRSNFEAFYTWAIASNWQPGLQIDRMDNNGPYSPENCRIVTRKQNCRNTRRNRLLTAWGETKPLSAWLEDPRCKTTDGQIRGRLDRCDWTDIEATLSIVKPQRGTVGEAHPKAKLTATNVRTIIANYHAGRRVCELAREYGVTSAAVSAIVHGKVWKHLQPGDVSGMGDAKA